MSFQLTLLALLSLAAGIGIGTFFGVRSHRKRLNDHLQDVLLPEGKGTSERPRS